MVENMAVSDDKQIIVCNKVLLTFFFTLLFVLRLSIFYEIPGIRVVNGLGVLHHYPLVFFTSILFFTYGVWAKKRNDIFSVILEDTSICLMVLCEVRYLVYYEYFAQIKYMRHGFWAYMALSIFLVVYCSILGIYSYKKGGI